jgi:hypothetical protein
VARYCDRAGFAVRAAEFSVVARAFCSVLERGHLLEFHEPGALFVEYGQEGIDPFGYR